MATRWYYVGTPEDGFLPGVPQADLSDEQFDGYPAHIQNDIRESPLWVSRNPNPTRRARVIEMPDAPADAPAEPVEGDTDGTS